MVSHGVPPKKPDPHRARVGWQQVSSVYGSSYNTTPTLVEEAAHALVFENFYAHAPYSFCSFMALRLGEVSGHALALRSGENLCTRRPAPATTDACLRAEAARGA